jgi:hypothetical protein
MNSTALNVNATDVPKAIHSRPTMRLQAKSPMPFTVASVPNALASTATSVRPTGLSAGVAPDGLRGGGVRTGGRTIYRVYVVVEIVRPRLHHDAPLRQMLGVVVVSAGVVRSAVRQLTLDGLGAPSKFAEQCAGRCTKSVRSHLAPVKAQ